MSGKNETPDTFPYDDKIITFKIGKILIQYNLNKLIR